MMKNESKKGKRFTITIKLEDYQRLKAIAEGDGHRPRLSVNYVVLYAIKLLFSKAEDANFVSRLGDPLPSKETDDQL
ncbi:MAG TPA: hypothetical protein VFA07_07640 [Chthonomonadaceae bacterium]|nr:hypothetical protein [Chthonomonadaceae bacterium]